MAPVSPFRSGVARFSPLLDNRFTTPAQVKPLAQPAEAAQRVTRPPEQVSDPRFNKDTFTPDAGPSERANAVRLLGASPAAQVSATATPATATRTANAGNRPVASRPEPSELPGVAESDYAHGQNGPSPNETGRIGGAAELAQYAYAGYNGGRFGPLSIAPAKLYEGDTATDVHLVSISGTEPVSGQSTGWITNIKSSFQQNNPGLRNAKEAILSTVPEGSTLVLTGHSQGGMIAQQLAADPDIKAKYDIKSTVTFGSPLISAGFREGEVHRIAARFDPVPRLSLESVVAHPWAYWGQQNIGTDTWNPIASHSQNYTDENNAQLARMDALGRVNPATPATLEVDVGERVFFSSPTNTIAGTPEAGELPTPLPVIPLPGIYPPSYPYHTDDENSYTEEWESLPLNPFPSVLGDHEIPPYWDLNSDDEVSFEDMYSLD